MAFVRVCLLFFCFLIFFSSKRSQLRTIFGCDDNDGKVYYHERENKAEPGEWKLREAILSNGY